MNITDLSAKQDWLNNPLLIYGPRKGGTTLLENLHDGNNALFVHSREMKLKSFLKSIWTAQPDAAHTYLSHNIINETPEGHHNHAKYTKTFSSLESHPALLDVLKQDIYNLYCAAKTKPTAPQMWVIKEVGGHTTEILALWRMLTSFDAPIIMILRDPLMVARSIITDRRRKKIKLSSLQLVREIRESCKVLIDQLGYLGDKNTHFLTYDSLTESPVETMRNVCAFLNIEYEDINSKPTVFGQSVVVNTSSKNSNKVFKSEKKWSDDLSLRERIILKIGYMIFFRPWVTGKTQSVRQIKNFDDVKRIIEKNK